jgi:O-methyltransferase
MNANGSDYRGQAKAAAKFARDLAVQFPRARGWKQFRNNVAVDAGGDIYEYVYPVSTYAPWRGDAEFLTNFQAIRGHTLVDVYRCWELWTLVGETAHVDGSLLEVGVWRGGTGALISRRVSLMQCSDPVYLCDTFTGVVKASSKDNRYTGGEHSDTSVGTVSKLLESLGLHNAQLLKGVFPEETGPAIAGSERFRFCHIDVDVYESARDVLDWVWPRLNTGGIVVFDDFGFASCRGIRDLVEEQRGAPDRFVVHNLNGHGLLIKTK